MAKEIKIIEMLKESKEASEIWQFIKPQKHHIKMVFLWLNSFHPSQ